MFWCRLKIEGQYMKIAIIYHSKHHGNTLQVISAMAEGRDITLIDIRKKMAVHPEDYDCIGFASGIYGFEMSSDLVSYARQYLPENKKTFVVYTYSIGKGTGAKNILAVCNEKHCQMLGEFSCKGFTTFGPFALIKGICKGHPSFEELAEARQFMDGIEKQL